MYIRVHTNALMSNPSLADRHTRTPPKERIVNRSFERRVARVPVVQGTRGGAPASSASNRLRRSSSTSASEPRPVTSIRRSAQKSYALFAAASSAGTFANAYTHPSPTAAYARSNTSTPVMTSPLGSIPCMVLMAVANSMPRLALGSYRADAMSTRSSFPRPASLRRRKSTSRTHSGQSPSYNTRTSHVIFEASQGAPPPRGDASAGAGAAKARTPPRKRRRATPSPTRGASARCRASEARMPSARRGCGRRLRRGQTKEKNVGLRASRLFLPSIVTPLRLTAPHHSPFHDTNLAKWSMNALPTSTPFTRPTSPSV